MVQVSCKPSFRTLLCAKIRNLIESSKYLDKNLLSEPNAQKDSNSYTIFCKKGDTLTQGWHIVLFWKVTVYPSTRATSRKINGSYSEISVPYSQITKGYWRAIWHWLVTLRAERRSAPCCPADSREVSGRQSVAEWRLAGKVSAVARFPRTRGLLTARCQFAYCSLVVCLLEAMTPPNRSEFL